MCAELSIPSTLAIKNASTSVHRKEHPFPAFVIAARALWPRKTAAHLAARSGVSERAAKFWLSGDRDPSPEAFMSIMDKIMGRRID
jgi:hypothetical protein